MTDEAQDDSRETRPIDLGIYNRRVSASGLSAAETIALGVGKGPRDMAK